MAFRSDFVWGAGASSYQIEGAAREDGKGPSVWDEFCRQPGRIWSNQSGDVACDHYHRYGEDISLMKEIGLSAYRLSISWPRVIPGGTGAVNPTGLAFYDSLVDDLLRSDIVPYITLFHWDYPYELYRQGGWLARDSSDWFADYARVVVDKLSDRVRYWITLNEPQCFIGLGHQFGFHAPGDRLEFGRVLTAAHNALLAHGKAVQAIRTGSRTHPLIGLAPVGLVNTPATESPRDIAAARQSMFAITDRTCWNNTWWTDPVFLGRYPEDALALFGADMPAVNEGDMQTICQPLDFFGVNVYFSQPTRAGEDGRPEIVPLPAGQAMTAFNFPVLPEGLYWGPRFYWERYGLPILITENGMANIDWVAMDGAVHDPQRIDFLRRYLLELRRACGDGVDVLGYFQWSILDNFEWTEGYKQRFGLIYVDYPSQKRILKDSACWYGDVIASNGAGLDTL